TDSWKSVWDQAIEAYISGNITNIEIERQDQVEGLTNNDKYRIFTEGRAAMVEAETGLLGSLTFQENEFEWGVVPLPGTYQIYMQASIFAIHRYTSRPDEARQVVQFMTGSEMMKQIASIPLDKGGLYGLPARPTVLEHLLSLDLTP